VCTDLSRDFDLHFLRVPRSSRSALRGSYSVATLSSKRLRNERERRILDSADDRAKVLELQGQGLKPDVAVGQITSTLSALSYSDNIAATLVIF